MAGKRRNKNSDFLVQGSILAIASIVSRIIGLVYRIPLTNILGNDGNNYYGTAYDIYNILLLISSYSLPLAVSKLVAARLSAGEKVNAFRIFKGAFVFALVTGSAASFVVFFFADRLTVLLATPQSYLALKVLGPTLLIVAIMGVVRGFFQGMGTMVPSAMSQIIEQIVNAVVSVAAAYVMFNMGLRAGALIGNAEGKAEEYAAAGGTLGTGAGAAVALIFLLLVFMLFYARFKAGMRRDRSRPVESYSTVFYILVITIIPVLLSTTVYNISSILDQGFFKNIALAQGYSEEVVSDWWGIFVGKYKILVNLPIALASALAASAVPSITAAFTSGDVRLTKQKIASSMRFIMLLAFPCTAGLFVLAGPILTLLFGDSSSTAAHMLMAGAISVVFYSISTLSNAALQGIDRMSQPVKNALISLVLHLLLLLGMMYVLNMNIYAVIWANTFFALFMCVLNSMSIRKYLRYNQEIVRTFVIPCICSVIMGGVVFGFYKLTINLCGINSLCTVFAIAVGVVVYTLAIVLLKGVTREEILEFPGGGRIVGILAKFRLM
ncbi:MAG: polysaccharide biosynthesis protein [Eubacterium sp.]|nr:polysaccharide biosynthesis protein [Eubacterium sp.]